jgi:hypothetical protein
LTRVCYFYSSDFPEAVAALPPGTEMINTSRDEWAWWNAFRTRWGQGADLVTVDQDVVLVSDVVTQFDACPQPWCVFPYSYGPEQLLCHSMGCTRFRAAIQYPLRHGDRELHWSEYDGAVRQTLTEDNGLPHPHVHFPPLRHLHPGLGQPSDPEDLWHQLFDGRNLCRGYVVQIGDSDGGAGSDAVR